MKLFCVIEGVQDVPKRACYGRRARRAPIPPMTSEPSGTSDPTDSGLHRIAQKLKHEVAEWIVMFLYLWVVFGLFALHQSILRGAAPSGLSPARLCDHQCADPLSKVMLVGEGVQLARGRPEFPPNTCHSNEELRVRLTVDRLPHSRKHHRRRCSRQNDRPRAFPSSRAAASWTSSHSASSCPFASCACSLPSAR